MDMDQWKYKQMHTQNKCTHKNTTRYNKQTNQKQMKTASVQETSKHTRGLQMNILLTYGEKSDIVLSCPL